jgi:predicted Abi (CAAX) family protease
VLLTGYSAAFKTLVLALLALLVLVCVLLYLYSASLWTILANNNLLRPS